MYINAEKYKIWLRKNYNIIVKNANKAYEAGCYEDAMSLYIEARAFDGILSVLENPEDSGVDWMER